MTTVKLSKTSKLGCYSWSLEAIETCPGSIDPETKSLVDACRTCYATGGNYRFPSVKNAREYNRTAWKQDSFVSDFIQELDNHRYFRWFDSGDAYALPLLEKIHDIIKSTPWCNHWLPTRMYKFEKFRKLLEKINRLPNAVVRYSSDSIEGEIVRGKNTSTIIPSHDYKTRANTTVCPAYQQGGKCLTCRACFDKSVKTVAYVAHGQKAAKLIKTLQIAA